MDLSKIVPKDFYSEYLKLKHLSGDEYRAKCPFHGDTDKPNLTINTAKGIYHCFACHASGNMVDYFKAQVGTVAEFAAKYGILSVPKEKTEDNIQALKRNGEQMKYLTEVRGISRETLERYKIGYDGQRITIPIFDAYGMIINNRRYNQKNQNKMISYGKGYGKITLFPIENTKQKKIYLCGGEWDCILMNQNAFNTVTVTGGEGSWKDEWAWENKEVIIIFDCDKAGRDGALRVADKLFDKNKVKIVDLGLGKGEDITDWFMVHKKSKEELDKLITNTEWYLKEDENYANATLANASGAHFYNKDITFKAVVAGKNLSPYQVPEVIELQCDKAGAMPKCSICALSKANGYLKVELNDRETILQLIDVSKSQLIGLIKEYVSIPKCGSYYILNEKKRNIEEVKLIPEIEFTEDDEEYVVRKACYIGDDIKTNQTYTFFGTTLPDPKNQLAMHLLEKSVPARDNIEEFKLDEGTIERLKVFQVGRLSIKEKLKEIYKDFSYNVTRIYHRDDLLMGLDLVWHSALNFKFLGRSVPKGWVEMFIIGDSRTGKSESVKEMIKHYRCGERITAENTTAAGLIAGLQQTQQRWTLMWGKIPLNDKRLLIIDEAGGLSHDDFSMLSDIRSSGIAEIIKVQTQKTKARTRLIFMANPLKRRLVEYSYGIMAIKEVVGQNEDIARFDFVMSVSDMDVPNSEINKRHNEDVPHKYTSDASHDLIMFAWSRKEEHILITPEAEDRILEVSKEFSETFTKIIPLVQGAEIRMKLAKMSVAMAIRVYSTDRTGEKVIVNVEHVNHVREYLLQIYSKAGLDYKAFSDQRRKESTLHNIDYIQEVLKTNNRLDVGLVELLLDNNRFTMSDFENFLDIERKECKPLVSSLLKSRAIKKYSSSYIKTPAFISYLKDLKDTLDLEDETPEDEI